MRKIILLGGLLIILSSQAFAQEAPPFEVFAGYSYFRPDGGGSLHGWNFSATIRVWRWLEIDNDTSGHYGRQSFSAEIINDNPLGNISIKADSDASVHTFLIGPRFSYRGNKKLTPFVHNLYGVSHLHTDATIRNGPLVVDSSFADLGFAFAIGGGVDVSLSESVGLRLFQVDYVGTKYGGGGQGNLRVSFGFTLH